MGLFGFGGTSSSKVQNQADIVARYQRLRPLRLRLNNKLVGRLSRDVLNKGAERLGLLRGDTFVFDDEGQMSVLMDYCIYDVRCEGRNAVDQYLRESPPDPDSEEMECLLAMQHATYGLVVVRRVERGIGCHVENLFTEESHLLLDTGLSQTAQDGLILATRVLDFGEFVTTSGVALPAGILNDDQLVEWQRELRSGRHEESLDPAVLIRQCLQSGASENVTYTERVGRTGPKARTTPSRTKDSAQQQRLLARRNAGNATTNRRCRCGSGKMFKNCCGKR